MKNKADCQTRDDLYYWIEVDPENFNPTGNICWGTYNGDRPIQGFWIKVKSLGVDNREVQDSN